MNFTYNDYIDIITYLKMNGNNVWIRHDIDFSLDKAVRFAEFEADLGIKSIYYILVNGPYYNPFHPENIEKIKMIKDLGHSIGIHFDLNNIKSVDATTQANLIHAFRALLEYYSIQEINYITFHRMIPSFELVQLLSNEELYFPDMNKSFKYITDTNKNWTEDISEVAKFYPNIQINVHPEWWTEEEMDWESNIHQLRLDTNLDKLIEKEIKSIRESKALL